MHSDFGIMVERERIARRIETKFILDKLELKSGNYSAYLHGKKPIPPKVIIGLSSILDIPIEKLQKLTNTPKEKILFRHYETLSKDSQKKINRLINELVNKEKN